MGSQFYQDNASAIQAASQVEGGDDVEEPKQTVMTSSAVSPAGV
jgi:hypothetical protein